MVEALIILDRGDPIESPNFEILNFPKITKNQSESISHSISITHIEFQLSKIPKIDRKWQISE